MKLFLNQIVPGIRGVILLAGMIMLGHAEPEAGPAKRAILERLEKVAASDFTKIVDQSFSPNKRLAVGVGSLDGSNSEWEKIPGEEGAVQSFVLVDSNDCGNYLIDVRTNRVTGILDGSHFGTRNIYNHESMVFAWSANGRWLVEKQSWKWNTSVCTVHHLSAEGKLLTRLDFKTVAEGIVSGRLRKQSPKLSPEERRGYAVTIHDPVISNDGMMTVRISAEIPKDEDSVSVNLLVVAKVGQSKTGDLSAKVTKVEPLKKEDDE